VRRIPHLVGDLCATTLWQARSYAGRLNRAASPSPLTDETPPRDTEVEELRALVRRFPYWIQGRALLAKRSLQGDDVATAYAEAQALLALAPKGSRYHASALFELGRCFLRRNDPSSALAFLDQALELTPNSTHVQEERSAALVLLGDKGRALEILKAITPAALSAEGKAALQWLSGTQSN
jgi:tetratricopeptide (TPR) repeat protein